MAARIRILPENLCNQIAAGEVVERPASVVKELLENSLDAGAQEIRIEVEGGGKRLIRITDDGEGMGREDVLLCLERHATSKLRTSEDLSRIATLGFRGEALPSIAAVSRFTVRSRGAESLEGWEVYAEAGTVRRAGAVGCAQGTMVEVRDLFFNTPARRKFLRKDETELGHIGDLVTRLALAAPEVQFRLVHDGRSLLEAPRHAHLEERIATLLGRPLLGELVSLDCQAGDGLGLRGFVARPEASRATTGAIYTYINGRFIRDRVVQHALLEGYRHLLPRGRYPVAVLFLAIDPAEVDVNVHPTKHEVRFRDQRQVHDFICAAVRQTLAGTPWLGTTNSTGNAAALLPLQTAETSTTKAIAPVAQQRREEVREAMASYARQAFPDIVAGNQPPPLARPTASTPLVDSAGARGYFSGLRVIGQFRRSYLLAQDGDDLVLIDQHAAHERIGFERLRQQFQQGGIERQGLLFPRVFHLDHREGAHLNEHLEELASLGFEVEPFGGQDFALKSVPRLLREEAAEALVRDVAAELVQIGASGLAGEALERLLLLLACHGMVRANQELAPMEIQALLADLDRIDFASHCPHGRPVLRRLTLVEVERMFKRS